MKQILYVLLILLPLIGQAQEDVFLSELQGMMKFNNDRIIELAQAIPAEKFDWAPSEEVVDVSGILKHVSGAIYFYAPYFGIDLPPDYDRTALDGVTGKEASIAAAQGAFAFAQEYLPQIDLTTLNQEVELPFGKYSRRELLFIMFEHSGEHKGQLIAYARMNGVVPPWSK